MKKLIIAAVILVSMSVQAVAGPIVTIKIRIGKPSLQCDKFGFCPKGSGVSLDFAIVPNGTEEGTTLQVNDRTGGLEIKVPASVWKEKENYFVGTTVEFDEAIKLGKKISSQLESSSEIIINSGKYNFKKDGSNNIIIFIPLSNSQSK